MNEGIIPVNDNIKTNKKKTKKCKKDKNQLIEDSINIKLKNLSKLPPPPEEIPKKIEPDFASKEVSMFGNYGVIRITEEDDGVSSCGLTTG
tara:strand:- start:767 stop:1039 length:273 start_codon:yes stop_codon:yes gene_type:complete